MREPRVPAGCASGRDARCGGGSVDSGVRFGLAEILPDGGAVAQLGERLNGIQEVARSIRVSSTNKIRNQFKAFTGSAERCSEPCASELCPILCPLYPAGRVLRRGQRVR